MDRQAQPATLEHDSSPAPSLPLMHGAFVLAGLGTMLLGPILPLLARQWHLTDSQSGLLLLAQFCGATVGGSSTSSRLQRGLMIGLLAAGAGFAGFSWAPGLVVACGCLVVAGFGVGRVIATVNIIAGARFGEHRGSALAWLNFSWSFGALLSPLSAAWLASRIALSHLLAGLAGLFLTVALIYAAQWRGARSEAEGHATDAAARAGLRLPVFVYFAALLLLYGGLETSLSGWLTTFALRYGQSSLVLSEYTMVLFLCGLTAGRALAGAIMRRMREARLQRIALTLSAALGAALAAAHTAMAIAVFSVLLGICLAPVFPATFGLALAAKPSARQAGIVLAASGIGAAALPWLMGVVSTHTGSLQVALALPVAAALAMLLLSLLPPGTSSNGSMISNAKPGV
jgi:FHS family glucose/mannose:H+ symporter-like MFS transporter